MQRVIIDILFAVLIFSLMAAGNYFSRYIVIFAIAVILSLIIWIYVIHRISKKYGLSKELFSKEIVKMVFKKREDVFTYLNRLKGISNDIEILYYKIRFPAKNEDIILDNGKKSVWPHKKFIPSVIRLGFAHGPICSGIDAFMKPVDKIKSDSHGCNYCEVRLNGKLVMKFYLNRARIYRVWIEAWGYLYQNIQKELFNRMKDASKDNLYSKFANRQLLPFGIVIIIIIILFLFLPLILLSI